MQDLRRTPFLVGFALLALAVLLELGASALIGGVTATGTQLTAAIDAQLAGVEGADEIDRETLQRDLAQLHRGADPPGIAIRYLALLHGLLLFSVGLLALGLLVPERLHGRAQGCVSLVVALVAIFGGIALLIVAFVKLLTMVALFVATPFGTLAYLALFGFFDRGGATTVLSLVLALLLGFALCLVIAQPRFLASKGLVLMTLTCLVAVVLVAFLHGFVPLFLVSIADAIAAIVVAVLALVWALVMLVLSIPALVKAAT